MARGLGELSARRLGDLRAAGVRHAERPRATYNASAGEYLVVWEDYRDGDADVYGQRLSVHGIPAGENMYLSDGTASCD